MANHNHLSSATCYNATIHKHNYYNQFFELGQQNFNFRIYELNMPENPQLRQRDGVTPHTWHAFY